MQFPYRCAPFNKFINEPSFSRIKRFYVFFPPTNHSRSFKENTSFDIFKDLQEANVSSRNICSPSTKLIKSKSFNFSNTSIFLTGKDFDITTIRTITLCKFCFLSYLSITLSTALSIPQIPRKKNRRELKQEMQYFLSEKQ